MNKIVSIHQPSYFPWLGLIDKIYKSNLYVVLDTVALNDSAFQARNIFLDHRGETHYLSIPINKKGYLQKALRELEIVDFRWQKKHKGFFIANYKKHPFFDEIYPQIEFLYEKKYRFLIDVLYDSLTIINKLLNIQTEMVLASELALDEGLYKNELVLEILKNTQATIYLSGQGAMSYQDDALFQKNNIALIYQEFMHPQYKQINTIQFKSGLSSLDMLFNIGTKDAQRLVFGVKK